MKTSLLQHLRPVRGSGLYRSAFLMLGLFSLLLLPVSLQAQGAGTIRGQVINQDTGRGLEAATVRLEGTNITASTDGQGRYVLRNAPSGTHTITATYFGVGSASESVQVEDGSVARQDFNLTASEDLETLEAFEVNTITEGQAGAINQQRVSNTITTMVVSDRIGRLPDDTVAEALSRIASIGIQKDRGIPNKITVRGADPSWNSVSLNGNRIPSVVQLVEGENNRSVDLDGIPADLIAGIEVTKLLTPKIDADSIGGNVNLKTKSPTDLTERLLTAGAEYEYNQFTDRLMPSFDVTYGDFFGENRQFGVIVNFSYSKKFNEDHNPEYEWTTVDELYDPVTNSAVQLDEEIWIWDEIDFRHRQIERKRVGGNVQFDWVPSENLRFYVKGFYSEFDEEEIRNRHRFDLDRQPSGEPQFFVGSTGHLALPRVARNRKRMRETRIDQSLTQLVAGSEWNLGEWEADFELSFSQVEYDMNRTRTDMRAFQIEGLVIDSRQNYSLPDINDNQLPFHDDLTEFSMDSGRLNQDNNTDEDITVQFDLTREFLLANSNPLTVSLGYKGRLKDKKVNGDRRDFDWEGPELTMADPRLGAQFWPFLRAVNGRFDFGPMVNTKMTREFILSNRGPDAFDLDTFGFIDRNFPNVFDASENIHALYLMGEYTAGKLTVLGGVRWERTSNDFDAFELSEDDIEDLVEGGFRPMPLDGQTSNFRETLEPFAFSDDSNYDNFFPSVVFNYRHNSNFIARLGANKALARPNFGNLVPFRLLSEDINDVDPFNPVLEEVNISEGNVDLDPTFTYNIDLSLEYYTNNGGVLSVGLFYKDIEDFIATRSIRERRDNVPFQFELPDGSVGDFTSNNVLFDTERPLNVGDAEITGIEVNLQQKFTFLPAPFDGFGINANATWVSGELDLVSGESIDALPLQVDQLWNVQLFYERGGFRGSIAARFNGGKIDELGSLGDPDSIVWDDEETDISAQVSYRFNENWEVTFKGSTLFEDDTRKFEGTRDRTVLLEQVGWSASFGINYNL